jgi:hypothetical protein
LEAPHIIHLDSGRGKGFAHKSRQLSGVLRKWLNEEWHRLHPTEKLRDPFNDKSMPLLLPEGNSCDVVFPFGQRIFCIIFLISIIDGFLRKHQREFVIIIFFIKVG